MNLDAVLAESRKRGMSAMVVPPRFVDFCAWIGVTLHPAQLVYCKVVYDGVQPTELEGEEREIAAEMFGGIFHISPILRRKVFTLAGGRAGKTYVFGALRLLWGAFVRDLSPLAPGEKAMALVIAPDDDRRQQVMNYQCGALQSRPELEACVVWPKRLDPDHYPERVTIRRPHDGRPVTLAAATCKRGGVGGRGISLTDCLMDEAAFFLDAKYVVNDKELFTAASPRVMVGGQTIAQTTAFAEIGYHWEQFSLNMGHPIAGVSVRATTEQLRPDAAEMVALERAADPDNARREFDAIPLADAAFIFFKASDIDACVQDIPWFGTNCHAGDHNVEKSAGGDMAFRSNSSTLAISYRVMGALALGFLREEKPRNGVVLRPSETVVAFAKDIKAHGVSYLTADGHYRESVVEYLDDLQFVDAEPPDIVAMRAKKLIQDGRVRIPNPAMLPPELAEPVRRLIKQLKEVRGQPTAGGRMTIHLPKWPDGSHGDLAAAFMLSLFPLAGESADKPKPRLGTNEWADEEMARLQAELREQAGRR